MPSISLRLNVVKVSVGDASSKTEFRAIARRGVLAWRNSLLVKRIGIESRPKNEKGGCSEQSFNGCFIHCDWVNHAGLQDSVQVLALLSVSGRTGGINDCAPDPSVFHAALDRARWQDRASNVGHHPRV